MQIKAIDPLRAYDSELERDIVAEPGDVVTVGETFGKLACFNGWAEDVAGQVPTGTKSRDPVNVVPQNISTGQEGRQ